MKLSFVVLSSLVLVTVVGCSKPTPEEQKKKEEEFAAAIASTLSAAAPPAAGTAAAAPAGGSGKILGQCVRKESSSCKEISGVFGLAEEETCKGLDGSGVFTKGEKPCPKENVIATCDSVGGEQKVTTYTYADKTQTLASQRESAKIVCSFTDGKYAEVAVAPAAAGAPAKKATAAAAPKPKK
jgi:hypothetical protein